MLFNLGSLIISTKVKILRILAERRPKKSLFYNYDFFKLTLFNLKLPAHQLPVFNAFKVLFRHRFIKVCRNCQIVLKVLKNVKSKDELKIAIVF